MSIKLSESHINTFIRAANDPSLQWPLHLAPEALQKASALADDAYWKWVDASDKADDAEHNLPVVQANWNKAAEDAVRDDEDLPSTQELDRAKIKVKVTQEDALKAEKILKSAQVQLAKLLEDESVTEPWRLAIEDEASKLQAKLAREIEKIDPLLTTVGLLLGLSRYLGDSGQYNYPPRVVMPDPREGLEQLIRTKPWEPAAPAGNIARV